MNIPATPATMPDVGRYLRLEVERLSKLRDEAAALLSRLQQQVHEVRKTWQSLDRQVDGLAEYLGLEQMPF